jgi:hypothetical protein
VVRVRHAIYEIVEKFAEMPAIVDTPGDVTDRRLMFWSVYSYSTTRRARLMPADKCGTGIRQPV